MFQASLAWAQTNAEGSEEVVLAGARAGKLFQAECFVFQTQSPDSLALAQTSEGKTGEK